MKKAYLILEDGTVYQGYGFGAEAIALGELVFNTGVVGYLENLTDPAGSGQILMQTFPLIGNYGVIEEDFEGPVSAAGYVVRECCPEPSNFRSQYTLDTLLREKGVPGICGVDTRAITRKLRSCGTMKAMICTEIPADPSVISAYIPSASPAEVSTREKCVHDAEGEKKFSVGLLDCGAKASLIRALVKRGCTVTRYPFDTPAEVILAAGHDGVLISGGPGDPVQNSACILEIAKLMGSLPLLGVGLGHQMAAIAMGAQTAKMLHGHRGASQPVRHGGRTLITSQNHGYEVVSSSVVKGEIAFVNANDGSCEGISYPALNALTVQFDPDSCILDRFMTMMGGENACR